MENLLDYLEIRQKAKEIVAKASSSSEAIESLEELGLAAVKVEYVELAGARVRGLCEAVYGGRKVKLSVGYACNQEKESVFRLGRF